MKSGPLWQFSRLGLADLSPLSVDAVYVLAFSTIMLNTDLHNPSIKKKMEMSEFLANNRGVNEGEDLPGVFLEDLYQRILEEEIKTEDTKQYPNALKRGFLFFERKSRIRGKRKLVKLWFILDTESDGLYGYKKETVCTDLVFSFSWVWSSFNFCFF